MGVTCEWYAGVLGKRGGGVLAIYVLKGGINVGEGGEIIHYNE